MYILSLDTTAKTAAAGIIRSDGEKLMPCVTSQVNSTLTHSESLLPMIDFCLKNAHISLDDISCIAVSAGPGSFTGVRIGISAVKGLAFGRDIECIGVSTLHALALNADDEKRGSIICPVMDARRNQFYNALFSCSTNGSVKRLCSDRAISFDELCAELETKYGKKNIIIVGDGAELFISLLNKENKNIKATLARSDKIYQNAYSVAKAALSEKKDGCDYSAEKLLPVYLRLSQAERERNERMANQ